LEKQRMLKFTTAVDADSPLVASLIQRCFQQQAQALAISEIDYPSYVAFETEVGVRRRIASGIHVALAYLGEEPIGTVSCALQRDAARPSEIMRLGVLPGHRGAGYGRELMQYAEGHLVAVGALVAEVSIVAKFDRLRAYYEDLGYSVWDSRQVPSLPFELLFMQKTLNLKLPPTDAHRAGTARAFGTEE
jgi:GNAT superfamily N-acetyltransferase